MSQQAQAEDTPLTCLDTYQLEDFQKMRAVLAPAAFDARDIAAFDALAAKAVERAFTAHGHLHSKLYLHAQRLIQQDAPGLYAKLMGVVRDVDKGEWGFLREGLDVRIRVVEYHTYVRHGGLCQKDHFDGGSLLTMVVMLRAPGTDFGGGVLQTWEADDTFKSYGLAQGDCVVFPSHKFHNVTPVSWGVRNIVAVEVWAGEEGEEDHRPGAFGHLIPDW
eukprot:TRINITY_DN7031_c0_g2_i1.p1 TRINITY_DN7031_c0_g2~~TRINITY_DN7031_c0_g2_i1.p1  ORF type:complete len:253 (+),score=13.37 TRINITY_DN7031_c0_g2_i1:105-761(+)